MKEIFHNEKKKVETRQYLREDQEAFYRWLREDQSLSEFDCTRLVTGVIACEKYAQKHFAASCKLFSGNKEVITFTAKMLFEDDGFSKLNDNYHNLNFDSLRKFLAFSGIEEQNQFMSAERSSSEESAITASIDSSNNLAPETQLVSSKNEVDLLLAGDDFAPLREILDEQQVTTIEGLKEIKLWPLMNRYNLYSIGMRQKVLSKVHELLYSEAALDEAHAYSLQIGNKIYKGTTPAEAYLHFSENMLNKHPLQLRSLVGMRMAGGKIPIERRGADDYFLRLPGLYAAISMELSKDEVTQFAYWICKKCGEDNSNISITDPVDNASDLTHTEQQVPSYYVKPQSIDFSSFFKSLTIGNTSKTEPMDMDILAFNAE